MPSINFEIKKIIEQSKKFLSTPLSSISIQIDRSAVTDCGKYFKISCMCFVQKYDEIKLNIDSWIDNITLPKNNTWRSVMKDYETRYYEVDLNGKEYKGHSYYDYRQIYNIDKSGYFDSGQLIYKKILQQYVLHPQKFVHEK